MNRMLLKAVLQRTCFLETESAGSLCPDLAKSLTERQTIKNRNTDKGGNGGTETTP